MIKITFINVGHGDSICLEWVKDGKRRIGIIDSNNPPKQGTPTIDYINSISFDEVFFILLSHPHLDHYSGMLDLINHCVANSISIKHVIHTSIINSEFIRANLKSLSAQSALIDLFKRWSELHNNKTFDVSFIGSGMIDEIPLTPDLQLKILSPSHSEQSKYITSENYNNIHDEEGAHNKPIANLLSTFLAIHSDKWYILLTSDVEKATFHRIKNEALLKKKLKIAQCAHHGSIHNFFSGFWRDLNKDPDTPIVFSCGKNTYNHPNGDIIKKLRRYGYEIYSTNKVGGIQGIEKEDAQKTTALNMFSTVRLSKKHSQYMGNKSFIINTKGVLNNLN